VVGYVGARENVLPVALAGMEEEDGGLGQHEVLGGQVERTEVPLYPPRSERLSPEEAKENSANRT